MKEDAAAKAGDDEPMGPRWKTGDRVYAVWAGNGCYYSATVAEVNHEARSIVVTWDDNDASHNNVSYDQVMEPSEDTTAWAPTRIDRRVSVRDDPQKGRCLFTNEACEPGQVVFVEKPCLVALPALSPKLWEHLQKLHEAQPLNLGTVTFHFAAIMSQVELDKDSIKVILDKFVPDPDEDPGEDVLRILASLQESNLVNTIEKLKSADLDAKRLQRLVSAWRYNSFGHHKEDGLVLYNRISMCSHSCDPSCCWSYGDEDAFVLRARVAMKGGTELTISYLQDEDLLKSTAVRQTKLQNWRFTCACTRCGLPVDAGRGFRCRRCRIGILYVSVVENCLESCRVCASTPNAEDQKVLLHLEEEYVARVESLDKTDVVDVETVYQAAIDIFERHWILYVMDTILWEAYREKAMQDAIEHQRRRIEFHEHYYCRPTFILAWCHEEMGDSLQGQAPNRKWQFMQEFQRAYQMLAILCGTNHQYTASPYNKLWQASNAVKDSGDKAAATKDSAGAAGGGAAGAKAGAKAS
jgi:hypothetical protein|mmetsp:Transcript_66764/g.195934  ORF Transcript_66764/g.195934 Transcript_66764/m.195934 type:complete len:524 (-) Transcript_66764:103-1674(-)